MTSGYYRDTCLHCKNTMNPEKCNGCLSTEGFQNFEPRPKDPCLEREWLPRHQFGVTVSDRTEPTTPTTSDSTEYQHLSDGFSDGFAIFYIKDGKLNSVLLRADEAIKLDALLPMVF